MKTTAALLVVSCLGISADSTFVADRADATGTGMNTAMLARIPARMKEFVDAGKSAGIVTLVARHGRVASLEAVGFQDLDRKTPMRVDSIFRVMSVTKTITCAGVMILVDEGRFSLIDPVERFIPEFKGIKVNPCGTRVGHNCELVEAERPIEVLDLMTHTSGLGERGGGRGGPRHLPIRWERKSPRALRGQRCSSSRGPPGTTATSELRPWDGSSKWLPGNPTTSSWRRGYSGRWE